MSSPTFFRIRTGIPGIEALREHYGAFDPESLSAKQRTPEGIAEATKDYDQDLIRRAHKDPFIGFVAAIGYLDGGTEADVDVRDERSMIEEFWARAIQGGNKPAGWGVHSKDLQFLKVRSWRHSIQVPPSLMTPAQNGRARWHGFTDIQSEYTGSPSEAKDFDLVARAFGGRGERASSAKFWSMLQANGEAACKALSEDLAQMAHIAHAMGLSQSAPTRTVAPAEEFTTADKPTNTYWDIETGPGELARLKNIAGEFDPAKVKTGNLTDPLKIQAKVEAARAAYDDTLLKRSMLEPELGRISAIGFCQKSGDDTFIPEGDERAILAEFWRQYDECSGDMAGWNTFNFDLKWVLVRSWILGIPVPEKARSRAGTGYARWHKQRDMMWEFTGDPRQYMSLDAAARFFGMEGKNGKGDEFFRLYESSVPEERAKGRSYLHNDVGVMTVGVAEHMGVSQPEFARKPIAELVGALEQQLEGPGDDRIPGL